MSYFIGPYYMKSIQLTHVGKTFGIRQSISCLYVYL